jgi:energy-coupling factor transporter ATP-binding protein EcfA2/energy-coupling factor transporter transmembrane protein EcfT
MIKISQKAVEVTNLTWTPFASSVPLLRDVSFTLNRGERVLLVGPSGSGKSTLLRALAGVLNDSESGDLAGSIVSDSAGLLLQDPYDALVSDTVYREVAFGLENAGEPCDTMPTAVRSALDSVGLNQPLEYSSTDLSGGEMQRMAFAGVIVANPALLLLDEPTSMLDGDAADSVRKAVAEHLEKTGATLLVVEHRFEAWLGLVDRMLVLNDRGELVLDGPPKQLLDEHSSQLVDLGIWVPGIDSPSPDRLDFGTLERGKITVLTGPSGAGKTTELKHRMRENPYSWSIQLGAGYVPQQPELTILGNTVFESVHYTAERSAIGLGIDKDVALERTRTIMKGLRVAELSNKNPYEISGGEQRRVAVATALTSYPHSAYLDEPTVGQDRDSWAAIVGGILAARASGIKLTIATHDADLIALADEVVEIKPTASTPAKSRKPLVSGLAILLAPILLLLGSMAVTSVLKGALALGALALSSALLALLGFRLERPKSFIPGLIGIASIGLSNWYLSPAMNPQTGLTAALRVALFVLPGIALALELGPIALGDQLGQILRLPARPVVAAVAAMQRMRAQLDLWDELRFIHRIRGVDLGRGPIGRVKAFGRLVFAQLVQAIRSAGTTAVAMDARGFSRRPVSAKRTWALAPAALKLDFLVLVLAVAIAGLVWFLP